MSAAEVIELIKKLPPEEKAEVIAFVNGTAKEFCAEEPPQGRQVRYISKESFESVVPKIFEKHEELFRRLAQ